MIAHEIISRAAYEVGDDTFSIIHKNEYLRILDRVYRFFVATTRTLRKEIGFYTVANLKEYVLYGYDTHGNLYGDEFLSFNRAEYNGLKMFEVTFDKIKTLQTVLVLNEDETLSEREILYAIEGRDGKLVMHFAHSPVQDDLVTLYCNMIPRLGTIRVPESQLSFDMRYHDALTLGVETQAWKRMKNLARMSSRGLKPEMVESLTEEWKQARADYMAQMYKVWSQTSQNVDLTMPLYADISSPVDIDIDFDDSVNYQ